MRKRSGPEPDAFPDGPSKTQLKRTMTELQDLGAAVIELPASVFEDIEMEDNLREALRELPRIKTYEGRRRHTQYIGKLMRDADEAPFRAAIDAHRQGSTRAAQALHEVERWRDRIVAGDEGLTAWIAEHPASSTQPFRTLVRNARREAEAAALEAKAEGGKPQAKGRAFRELFHHLRDAVAVVPAPAGRV